MAISYTKELEVLITEKLLPIYIAYFTEKGLDPDFTNINSDLLKQINMRKQVPALFKSKSKNGT